MAEKLAWKVWSRSAVVAVMGVDELRFWPLPICRIVEPPPELRMVTAPQPVCPASLRCSS